MSYSAVVSQKTTLWFWGAWVKTWVRKSESVCRWTWPDLKRSWSDLETSLNSIFTGTLTSGIVAQKTTLWFCEARVDTWLSKSESVWKVSLTWTTHKIMSHCAQKFLGVSCEARFFFFGTLTSGIVAQKTTLWFCEARVDTWLSRSESVWKVSLTWTTHKMMSHYAQKFLGVSREAGSSTSKLK